MSTKNISRLLRFQKYNCKINYNASIFHKIRSIPSCTSFRGYVQHVTGSLNYHINNLNDLKNDRFFSNVGQPVNSPERELDPLVFDKISNETLESLSDYFDELVESVEHLDDADVSYRDGVLTIKFGNEYGTYVINRQTPNKQIWLSSPTSGPKRYDFMNGKWIYKHDGQSLHELLSNEIQKIVKTDVSFHKCLYSGNS